MNPVVKLVLGVLVGALALTTAFAYAFFRFTGP
jgi:hypothetical protein